jgi:hypothetical protein
MVDVEREMGVGGQVEEGIALLLQRLRLLQELRETSSGHHDGRRDGA